MAGGVVILMSLALEFSHLSAAIQVDNPTGKDLRKEEFTQSLYHKIKDARTAARALERQQIQGADISIRPNWSNVYEFSLQALNSQTKDLEITAWLIEALLREKGFAGLRDGFQLARELIENYWNNLYPMPDEDGLITRLAPLIGLNGEEAEGTLIVPIALVPLTQGRSSGPFSLWQYQQALELLKIADPEKRNQRLAAGAVTLEMIAEAVAETPSEFFHNLLQELNECIKEFKALNVVLEQKAGQDAPPSSRILAQLNACVDCIKVIARESINTHIGSNFAEEKQLINSAQEIIPMEILVNNATEFSINKEQVNHDVLQMREKVLKSIAYAADFFRRTEPHSPIPYLLERAVKWSKMPLPVLLKELIKDEQALGHFCNLTGVAVENG